MVSGLLSGTDGERPAVIRTELQEVMFSKCGVYRTEELLTEARDAVAVAARRARARCASTTEAAATTPT